MTSGVPHGPDAVCDQIAMPSPNDSHSSIKEESLNRIVPLGEWHLRIMLAEYVAHYHSEWNYQGSGMS